MSYRFIHSLLSKMFVYQKIAFWEVLVRIRDCHASRGAKTNQMHYFSPQTDKTNTHFDKNEKSGK